MNTGRFLDPPEFAVFHDKGNEQNIFDRVDYQLTPADSLHLNLNYSRSWFQTPNNYDNLRMSSDQFGNPTVVGNADQHSKIETFNIAPTYTRIIGKTRYSTSVLISERTPTNYFPSENPLADLGPPNLQTANHLAGPFAHQRRGPFRSLL